MIGNRFNLADTTANLSLPQSAQAVPQERFTSTDGYGQTARLISQMGNQMGEPPQACRCALLTRCQHSATLARILAA